ncbi:hypothetical protein BU24DRAFT_418987 [Aaosphaeria arxii CBS 175.79]|uniref:Uncharacterized protein n=1 Tax=Aaosphaeria arxii CBS 175.79 TaxID=1450172 RepID=A0A6A5Y1L9_9PLEO|nr:uncharacterized protein BU24DRAFT_418987 [Aaosphaeria arxii CBS 175.79]KAF2019372.1 hypothetical protein BU24DRAFT_418987 [Aaosphaeria arxii CBS 175.79]
MRLKPNLTHAHQVSRPRGPTSLQRNGKHGVLNLPPATCTCGCAIACALSLSIQNNTLSRNERYSYLEDTSR